MKDSVDYYTPLKLLNKEKELTEVQCDYLREEIKYLRKEELRSKEEIKRVAAVPLMVATFLEMVNKDYAMIQCNGGIQYVRVLSTLDRSQLIPSCNVSIHRHSNAIVEILPNDTDNIKLVDPDAKPDVSFDDIGGNDLQKQEIRETIEFSLKYPEVFERLGIDAPKGILLYGPPGTGKTMMVKALAYHTNCAFIKMVGSEFVQKYLGEGPKMIRDTFQLAKDNAPAIIFIDEVDSIAMARFDSGSSGDKEIQRILMELLNQMDGFDQTTNVKVIMATNRADQLDPALLRPGRLDRKVYFGPADRRQKRLIFQVCTSKMNLAPDVNLEDFVKRPHELTGAEISSICLEAGMYAVRKNRYIIMTEDLEKAYQTVAKRKESDQLLNFYWC